MSETGENGRIQRADPDYRRQMLVWLVVTIVAGAGLLLALHVWLGEITTRLAASDPDAYHRWLSRLLAGLCLILGAAAAAFAVWVERLARATRRDRRWPPVGMRTSSDLRIRYLTSADSLVTQLRSGAAALAVLALSLFLWAGWLLTWR